MRGLVGGHGGSTRKKDQEHEGQDGFRMIPLREASAAGWGGAYLSFTSATLSL